MRYSIPLPHSVVHSSLPISTFETEMTKRLHGTVQPIEFPILPALKRAPDINLHKAVWNYVDKLSFRVNYFNGYYSASELEFFDAAGRSSSTYWSQDPSIYKKKMLSPDKVACLQRLLHDMFLALARKELSTTPPLPPASDVSAINHPSLLFQFSVASAHLSNAKLTEHAVSNAFKMSSIHSILLSEHQTLSDYCENNLSFDVSAIDASNSLVRIFERSAQPTASETIPASQAYPHLTKAIPPHVHRYFSELIMLLLCEDHREPQPLITFPYSSLHSPSENQRYFNHKTLKVLTDHPIKNELSLPKQKIPEFLSSLVYICQPVEMRMDVRLFKRDSLSPLQQEACYAAENLLPFQRSIIDNALTEHLSENHK